MEHPICTHSHNHMPCINNVHSVTYIEHLTAQADVRSEVNFNSIEGFTIYKWSCESAHLQFLWPQLQLQLGRRLLQLRKQLSCV